MQFLQIFVKLSKKMLIQLYIPSYKHISCQMFLLQAKLQSGSFTNPRPSTGNFNDSPYPFGTPNFDSFLWKDALQGYTCGRLAAFLLRSNNYFALMNSNLGNYNQRHSVVWLFRLKVLISVSDGKYFFVCVCIKSVN